MIIKVLKLSMIDNIQISGYHSFVNKRSNVFVAVLLVLICSFTTGLYIAYFFPGIFPSNNFVLRKVILVFISTVLLMGFWIFGSSIIKGKTGNSLKETMLLDAYSFLPILMILNIPILIPRFQQVRTMYYSSYINSFGPKVFLFLLILIGNLIIKWFIFSKRSGFSEFIEKREKLILILLLSLYFAYFLITGFADYWIFGNWHDLCRNTQIYYTMMQGELFTSRLHSETNQKVYSLFCDHFKPSMVFFVPFFLLIPKTETILFLKTILMTLAGFPLFLLCRKLIDPFSSFLIVLTFLFFAPYTAQMYTGFHSSNIAPLFIFFTILYYYEKKFKSFNIFQLLTCSIKENLPFMLIMFVPLAFLHKRSKKWICSPLLINVIWTVVVFYLIFPHFRIQDSTYGISYAYAGVDKMATRSLDLLLHPTLLFDSFLQANRFQYLFLLLGPLLFIVPFFTKYALLTIPGLLSVTLLMTWDTPVTYHHPIEPMAFVFAATPFVLGSISKLKIFYGIDGKKLINILCLLMLITTCIQSPIWMNTKKRAPDPHYEFQKELFSVVPKDVTLATPVYLAAFFSPTNEIFYLNQDAIKPDIGAEYLIIDTRNISSPNEDVIAQLFEKEKNLDNYEVIWTKGPLYVLKSVRGK